MPNNWTLELAAREVADEGGLDWGVHTEREKAYSLTDRIRQRMWSFDFVNGWDLEDCVTLTKFCRDCPGRCEGQCFTGFSLPIRSLNVKTVRPAGGVPLPIVGKHGTFPMNVSNSRESCGRVQAVKMGEFSLQMDAPCGQDWFLWFQCMDRQDVGKRVRVRYTDGAGNSQDEDLELSLEGTRTRLAVRKLNPPHQFGGITLPAQMCGRVQVMIYRGAKGGANGTGARQVLAEIAAGVVAPSWTRYRVDGLAAGSTVEFAAERQYEKLSDPTAWVETEKGEIWRAGYRYVKTQGLMSADGQDQANVVRTGKDFVELLRVEQSKRYGQIRSKSVNFHGFLPQGPRLA